MFSISVFSRIGLGLFLLAALPGADAAAERHWQDPDSPFRIGEGYAEVPATCETIADWIELAPEIDARFSFSIQGELVASDWDGALAYLVMCNEPGIQIMCVTYSNEGHEVGQEVFFAGGWSRVDERKVLLDPCLATTVKN